MKDIGSLKFKQPAAPTDARPIGILKILQGANLIAPNQSEDTDLQKKWGGDTPTSLQLIQTGVSKLTKWWVKAIAAAGGITAAMTMVTGYIRSFTTAAGTPITVALIGGGALVAAAVILGIAIAIRGDLTARGAAAAAQLQARGLVLATFLQTETVTAPSPAADHSSGREATGQSVAGRHDGMPDRSMTT